MKRKIHLRVLVFVLVYAVSFLPSMGETTEPIKMLDLSPQSGVMKDVGDRNQMGVRFAVEEINAAGGLLGRPVKMFFDDSQVKPDVATRKAMRYIMEEKVQFLLTSSGTHVAKALEPVADKNKIILLNYAASGDELTGRDFTPYHFRMCLSTAHSLFFYS